MPEPTLRQHLERIATRHPLGNKSRADALAALALLDAAPYSEGWSSVEMSARLVHDPKEPTGA
jgi:hypothetical protein